MPEDFSLENVRRIVARAGELEMGAPSPQAAAELGDCYAYMDRAREAGVDLDAVIAEELGA